MRTTTRRSRRKPTLVERIFPPWKRIPWFFQHPIAFIASAVTIRLSVSDPVTYIPLLPIVFMLLAAYMFVWAIGLIHFLRAWARFETKRNTPPKNRRDRAYWYFMRQGDLEQLRRHHDMED